jgi:hypothetical protein
LRTSPFACLSGLGLQTKYSICFYIAGILAGVVLTRARRYLLSGWFWGGIALALVIFLPNLLWLVRHDFISYKFLQHIHVRDVGEGRAANFLKDQLKVCINVAATPLCLAGLIALFRSARYRMVAWMYLIPFALFWMAKGRGYYVAGAYPMLMAMGAAAAERWLGSINRLGRWAVECVYFAGLLICGAYITAVVVPLASSGPLKQFALERNGDLREEFGWHELVATVAGIRDSLPPEQQASLGVTVANYGEQGAIEMLGPAYHLPPPISTTNSAWLRGYPTPQPATLIVLGLTSEQANRIFTGCRLAGHNSNAEGVMNEESQDHPDIFVCGPPRSPWPELWARSINFG